MSRIELNVMDMPWDPEMDDDERPDDPIPAEIRARFSPDNRSNRARDPIFSSVPVHAVSPNEDLMWGYVEVELLNRLRTGVVTSLRNNGSLILAKVESNDGTVDRAYIRFGNQLESGLKAYKDMYAISGEALVRNAAAAYELAKAAGLDDLVAPTVYRVDEHSGLEPVLSISARDALASSYEVDAVELNGLLGHCAYLSLWTEGQGLLVADRWFQQMSMGAASKNTPFETAPYRAELLRAAAFDFLAWTGNRTYCDVLVCNNSRHRIHLLNNELSFPDPAALATAGIEYSEYSAGCPESPFAPLLWSDLVSGLMLRGYEEESRIYEEIAQQVSKSMSTERQVQLCRALFDHGVTPLAAAGLLVRLHFLKYGFSVIMRDPLAVVRYYSAVLTGTEYQPEFDLDIEMMEASVNSVINKASMSDFDFHTAMVNP